MNRPLKSCLIGCVFVALAGLTALGFLGYQSYRGVRSVLDRLHQTEETLREIRTESGPFLLSRDGRIESRRLQDFLRIRETDSEVQEELSNALKRFDSQIRMAEKEGLGMTRFFSLTRNGMRIIPDLSKLLEQRSEALLAHRMTAAEYQYLFAVTYYLYLGHAPSDGPSVIRMEDHSKVKIETSPQNRESRRRAIVSAVNTLFQEIFHRTLERSDLTADWRATLHEQLENLGDSPERLPWSEAGLPEAIQSSLRPFEARLRSTYRPWLNPLNFIGLSGGHSTRVQD